MTMKQGIVTILGSDCETNKTASIRRTLSADMSSKKWLLQNEVFCSRVKKNASFEELMTVSDHGYSSSSSESDAECENYQTRDDVWRSIQSQTNEIHKPAERGVWGTMLDQKRENLAANLPPYIHPQVKRSASCMSEKSLQICTEGLGSETGSDDFIGIEIFNGEKKEERESLFEDLHAVKSKNAPAPPLPPPLSSISGNGASVRIHPCRRDGRLVLEAIAVPPRKYLHAERKDGRLILTLINASSSTSYQEAVESVAEMEKNMVVEEKIEMTKAALQVDLLMEQSFNPLPSKMNLVDKISVMAMKRSHKFNIAMKMMDKEEEEDTERKVFGTELPISNSLPPRPPITRHIPPPPSPPSAACSFNAYEYFWRSKNDNLTTNPKSCNKIPKNQHKTEYSVHNWSSCNKQQRSIPIWETYCIATS